MKSYLMILFLSASIYSQKYHGYVVTNSNDTIKCKFKVQTNLINDNIFYPYSGSITTINADGEKTKYKPNKLKSYYLQGPNIKNYKFVSLKEDNHESFYDEILKGKICLYYHYKQNLGGGDSLKTIYILKDGRFEKIKGGNMRRKLGEFLSDDPEVYETWMSSNRSFDLDQMEYIIELYNKHFEA
jgi:hypothetical protein